MKIPKYQKKLGFNEETHCELTGKGYTRWCDGCQKHHSALYVCVHYPGYLKKEIRIDQKFIKSCMEDANFVEKQIRKGDAIGEISYTFFDSLEDL
jgi:hypothetical protein